MEADPIGRSFGNYRVVGKLGEGGMGTVYLAEHPQIGKKVAVKTLHARLCADPELVSRFFHEAKAVNAIGHPNIVDIADFGETADGTHYFVMELLQGKTLRQHLTAHGPLEVMRALSLARQVADAVGAAHRVGIVHRDLKPDNIFLLEGTGGGPERVKLFDFGVAKLSSAPAEHKTAPGMMVGTPYYMAPEQFEGRSNDASVDIYSLGVVLYEMLTGEVPFAQKSLPELLEAVLRREPAPPSSHTPGLPAWLDRFVLACLQKAPALRPHSMADFTAGLAGKARTEATGAGLAQTVVARAAPRPPPAAHAPTLRERIEGLRPHRKPILAGAGLLALLGLWAVFGGSDDVRAPSASTLAPETIVTLDSIPPGARVVRMKDNALVGFTPTREIQRAEGQTIEYLFRLPGYVDAHLPIRYLGGGDQTYTVTLVPQAPQTRLTRPAAPKRTPTAHAPPPPRRQPDPPRPAKNAEPAAAPASTDYELPPLLPANRVKRIGRGWR